MSCVAARCATHVMCHGFDLMSSSPKLAQHSNGERQPAMSILFAKNRKGIRRSFRSAAAEQRGQCHQLQHTPRSMPRTPAAGRQRTWVLEHVVQLLLGHADPQLVLAVHDVDHGVALGVVRRPQVTVRAGTGHVKHREGDVVLHELLDLEAHRRHHLVVLVLRRARARARVSRRHATAARRPGRGSDQETETGRDRDMTTRREDTLRKNTAARHTTTRHGTRRRRACTFLGMI
jgi:hypothetical protein